MPSAAPQATASSAASTAAALAPLIARGQLDEARARLAAALNHPHVSPEHLFQSARAASQLGMNAALCARANHLANEGVDWHGMITLGVTAMNVEAYETAARFFRRATQMNAGNAGGHALLGGALYQSGAIQEARRVLVHAAKLDPRNALAQHTLGSFYLDRGELDNAIKALAIATTAEPQKTLYRITLARAYIRAERYQEARPILENALGDKAVRGAALLALGQLHRALCDNEKAIAFFRQAVEAHPTPEAITPYLFHLLASDAHSDAEVFAEHARIGAMFDRPAKRGKCFANTPDPDRRLKIGFVSGDFHQHSVSHFITPLVRCLDRARFEIFGIHNNAKEDAATLALRRHLDHWHVCHGMSDQSVAEWIEDQRIDILIDLSGHSKLNRLGVFGLRAAPIQATYLGYPGSTGLGAMDYRITCEALDPSGTADALHTEELVRLRGLLAPFQPHGDVDVNPLPHLSGAPFMFGCLNPTWRINRSVMRAWGAILRANPDARMLLGNVDREIVAQHLRAMFADEGVGPERLELVARQGHRDYLKLHHRIDLALDTFPYNGGTTTLYSLWMGAPVVALEGGRTAGRTGAGVLREAGLDGFIASTLDEYVALACEWVRKARDLQSLRQSLRGRLRVCAAHEQRALVAEFGDALMAMWARWCAAQKS